jgi:hypothetical protein
VARNQTFRRIVELCDGLIIPVDEGDGWPSIADLKLADGLVRVALHVGPVGLSHRGRDDVERRFQNPGKKRPVVSPPGAAPLLVGLWEEAEHPVLVGMEAGHRVGTMTRQSLFISLHTLHQAARQVWADHHSATGEHLVAFHPELISTYHEFRSAGGSLSAGEILHTLESAGFTEEEAETPGERARRAASRLIRKSGFGQKLVKAYEGFCAMCGLDFGLVQGGHIYPVEAPESPDHLWNGLALCSNHHVAFDRHLIWIEPVSRQIAVHPEVREKADINEACHQFVSTTKEWLSNPVDESARPRVEMFEKRYEFFENRYSWAS